ncbi:methionyl-tRNA formyltransferase, partial [TM7 phylum sp. oral taxon 356]
AAVLTKPDSRRGRSNKLIQPAVKQFASQHHIPVWQPNRLKDIISDIKNITPRPTGVLVSYGKIIPQTIIDLFHPGIINVHPSLLPKYRGPSPIESAIANRDKITGVTIMQLEQAMDAGPIYYQEAYPLDFTETQPELYQTLGQLGAQLLMQKLPDIISGILQPTPQDDSRATYCSLLSKNDSRLDPQQLTADQAEAKIRAHLTYPRSRLKIGQYDLIITKACITQKPETPLDIKCADGNYLSISEVIAPSGKTISANAFLRGYPLQR